MPDPLDKDTQTVNPTPDVPSEQVTLSEIFATHSTDVIAPAEIPAHLNKDGSVKKRRGRPPKSANTQTTAPEKTTDNAPLNPEVAVPPREKISATAAAKGAANLTIYATVLLCGEEVGRPKENEAKDLAAAYKDYFDVRGVPDIPPEVGLAMAVLGYVAPRVMHDDARTRIQKIADKISLFIVGIRRRFWK